MAKANESARTRTKEPRTRTILEEYLFGEDGGRFQVPYEASLCPPPPGFFQLPYHFEAEFPTMLSCQGGAPLREGRQRVAPAAHRVQGASFRPFVVDPMGLKEASKQLCVVFSLSC